MFPVANYQNWLLALNYQSKRFRVAWSRTGNK